MLSPYYLTSTEDEDQRVHKLEQQILLSSLPGAQQEGRCHIPFSFVADSLERAYTNDAIGLKEKIAFNLVQTTIEHARDCGDPSLELLALLRICLPLYDNRSVYGFKTHKLLKSFAKAYEKCGGVSGRTASANLLNWIRRPIPVKQKKWVISMPEIAVAHAHALCFPHQRGGETVKDSLSILDIAALCQRLTNMYKQQHREVVIAAAPNIHITGIKVDKIAELLATVIPSLDYLECKVLVRLLLRSVSMGIGVKTFTRAISTTHSLVNRLDYQMDLCRLGMQIAGMEGVNGVLCGVPFRVMTCKVMSSPYVMRWLFANEENIKSYLPPKDGRLIVHSNGNWYVPRKRLTNNKPKYFIDLDSHAIMEASHKRKHMQILREIKRYKHLFLNENIVGGMVINYILSKEDNGGYIMVIRGVKTAEDENIEFVDSDVALDEPSTQYKQLLKSLDDSGEIITGKKIKKNMRENEISTELVKQLVIETPPKPIQNQGPVFTLRVSTITNNNNNGSTTSTKTKEDGGLIVQRKYDGDRMQAHLSIGPTGQPKVQLFSKSGKPVHHLYTDVANELSDKIRLMMSSSELPCILDGEIIVVNTENKPLPWSSAKWRYDSGTGGQPLHSIQTTSTLPSTIVSLVSDRSYCENLSDGESAELTLAPLISLKSWDQFGANEKQKIKVKILEEGARLLFVVFDMIMFKGKFIGDQPYASRLSQLRKLNILSSTRFSKIISQTKYIKSTQELIDELNISVRDKAEGLILKDPRARYVFGRSNSQRKLKICGPDINCGVAGMGFTISKNPRMCGILTVISSVDHSEFIVYNRVESIEGDAPTTAMECILSLSSCIPVDELTQNREIDMGKYLVSAVHDGSTVRVSWKNKGDETEDDHCTVCFPHGYPHDIQWLCNPLECLFGVSQRGDLHPLVWEGHEKQDIWVPRFPVCRIQWTDHQRSECDNPLTIISKFNEACNEPSCIQEFFKQRVKHLRNKPPIAEKLEELRRILLGKEDLSDTWPQPLDNMYKLEEFSSLLTKNGFASLTHGERSVLGGLNPKSQWDPLLMKKITILESENSFAKKDEMEGNLPFLNSRLRDIRRIMEGGGLKRPITMTTTHFAANENQKTVSCSRLNDDTKIVFTRLLYSRGSDAGDENQSGGEEEECEPDGP